MMLPCHHSVDGRESTGTGADTQVTTPSLRRMCRIAGADLLKRVSGIEALRCEYRHSMRVMAAITDPAVLSRILECMHLPPGAAPLTSDRALP
jgi:hypothetical protein